MQANKPRSISIGSHPDFQNTPIELICPLTKEIMKDPVVIETGRTFERLAIRKFFENEGLIDPVTKQGLTTSKCI